MINDKVSKPLAIVEYKEIMPVSSLTIAILSAANIAGQKNGHGLLIPPEKQVLAIKICLNHMMLPVMMRSNT